MKPILLFAIVMIAACRTAAPAADEPVTVASEPPDALAVVEASLAEGDAVERMHRDGDDVLVLVAKSDSSYELVRVRKRTDGWAVVAREPAQADYLWPEQ